MDKVRQVNPLSTTYWISVWIGIVTETFIGDATNTAWKPGHTRRSMAVAGCGGVTFVRLHFAVSTLGSFEWPVLSKSMREVSCLIVSAFRFLSSRVSRGFCVSCATFLCLPQQYSLHLWVHRRSQGHTYSLSRVYKSWSWKTFAQWKTDLGLPVPTLLQKQLHQQPRTTQILKRPPKE